MTLARQTATTILAALLLLSPCLAVAQREPKEEQLKQLLQRFPNADLNKDGKLTIDEFREFRGKTQAGVTVTPARPARGTVGASTSKATTASVTGPVEIRINSDKPVAINPKIYGINCAEMFIYDLVQRPEYLSALGELQFNTYLFPGGSSRHHPTGSGGFNIRADELAQSKNGGDIRINKQGYPDFFLQYIQFMKPMGGHAVFIPNLGNGTLDELDTYLRRMKDAKIPIETIVLGMEVQRGGPFGFESSAAYIAAIKPYIAFLKSKYPGVRISAWSTPIGRRDAVPGSYRQWNKDVAKVPGIDGFAQYGWTEFGGAALRGRGGSIAASTPEQRLREYDAFIEEFPKRQIDAYAEDWGKDKKMFMLQWGTHADRNTALEGLHSVNFLFFMTEYNATHDNYFEVATWSIPIMQDLTSGKRKNSGGGPIYKKDIALWAEYLFVKPLRYLYSGDKNLLRASVSGGGKNGAFEVVKAIAAAGADRKKYLCILNRGPAIALGPIAFDGKIVPSETIVYIESVSGESLTASANGLKTFAGKRAIGSVTLGPYGVTMVVI